MYDIEQTEFLYNTYIHIMRQKVDAQILFPDLKIPKFRKWVSYTYNPTPPYTL